MVLVVVIEIESSITLEEKRSPQMNRPRQALVASTLGFFHFCLVSVWLCVQCGEEIVLFTAEEMHVLIELEITLFGRIASHGGIMKVWSASDLVLFAVRTLTQ